MSRIDAHLGDHISFHAAPWAQYMSFFAGKSTTDLRTVALAKAARYNDSLTRNPEFVYGPREVVLSFGENALYLQSLSDPLSGRAPLAYVRSLFEHERLPFALGWRPSRTTITLASVQVMMQELQALSPEPLAQGMRAVQ